MNLVKKAIYYSVVYSIKAYLRVFMDFHVWGRECIPKGPKLYVSNHISAFDGLWVMPVFTEPVHFVVGPQYSYKIGKWILDAYDQINALPENRAGVVDEAVDRIRRGGSVFICPEGDFQDQFTLGRFYSGFAQIYRRTGVPIIPMALVAPIQRRREYPLTTVVDGRVYRCAVFLRGPFLINVGKSMTPSCPENLTEKAKTDYVINTVRDKIASLVEDARYNKYWGM